MSNFISCIFAGGLDRDPAGVERHGLADEAEQRAGDVRRVVAQRDQPRLLVGAAGDGGERAHPGGLEAGAVERLDVHAAERRRRASASAVGVSSLAGAFCRSRAALVDAVTVAACAAGAAHVVVGGEDQLVQAASPSGSLL